MQPTYFPCLAPTPSPRPLAHSHTRSRLLTRPNRSPTHPCVAHSCSLAPSPGCSCFAHPYLLTHSCRTRSYLLIHSPACLLLSLLHRLLTRALLAHTHSGFTRPYSFGLYSPVLTQALLARLSCRLARALLARLCCRLARALLSRLCCRLARALQARLSCRLAHSPMAVKAREIIYILRRISLLCSPLH